MTKCEQPLVSVIIPTYNCSKYILNAIESVLSQTYKNIELIVVDDGSTDDTQKIIEPYLKNIFYIFQENGGLANARNRGIMEAKGKYIALLDADDIWVPEKIEIQVSCLEKLYDVHMVFTDFSAFNEVGYFEKSYFNKAFPIFSENRFSVEEMFEEKMYLESINVDSRLKIYYGNIAKSLFIGNFILPSSILIKRTSILEVGSFNPNYRVAEETEFFLRFCHVYNVAFIDYPLVKYLLNRLNKLTSNKNISLLILNAIQIQENFIKINPQFYSDNLKICRKAIGKSYSRLSYYFISVFNKRESLKNALVSCKWYPFSTRPYVLIFLNLIPYFILNLAKSYKKKYHKIHRHCEPNILT